MNLNNFIEYRIKSEEEYEDALELCYKLFQLNLEDDSESKLKLELISLLIEEYESKFYEI